MPVRRTRPVLLLKLPHPIEKFVTYSKGLSMRILTKRALYFTVYRLILMTVSKLVNACDSQAEKRIFPRFTRPLDMLRWHSLRILKAGIKTAHPRKCQVHDSYPMGRSILFTFSPFMRKLLPEVHRVVITSVLYQFVDGGMIHDFHEQRER